MESGQTAQKLPLLPPGGHPTTLRHGKGTLAQDCPRTTQDRPGLDRLTGTVDTGKLPKVHCTLLHQDQPRPRLHETTDGAAFSPTRHPRLFNDLTLIDYRRTALPRSCGTSTCSVPAPIASAPTDIQSSCQQHLPWICRSSRFLERYLQRHSSLPRPAFPSALLEAMVALIANSPSTTTLSHLDLALTARWP